MDKSKETTKVKPSASISLTAVEKCQAVLSVWTEKRSPSEACKALSVPWTVLQYWQKRAMEGMLQALEPRVNLEKGPALSPRLQALLLEREKNQLLRSTSRMGRRLELRLANLTKAVKTESKPSETAKAQQKE